MLCSFTTSVTLIFGNHQVNINLAVKLHTKQMPRFGKKKTKTKANLFHEYKSGPDIKYLILSYLEEHEIHGIMSRVDTEWNDLCLSTYNHPKFSYKFDFYVNKLFNSINTKPKYDFKSPRKNIYVQVKAPVATSDYIKTKVYVQCPWDRLWTYGYITKVDLDGITITVENKEYNPFDAKYSYSIDNNTTTKSELSFNFKTIVHELYFEKKRENSPVRDADVYDFNDGYHHIAPVNTIDRTSIEEKLNLNAQPGGNNNSNNNKYDIDEILSGKLSHTPYVDYYNRTLVDVQTPFEERQVWLWRGKDSTKEVMKYYHNDKRWLCGIIDKFALNLQFPKWKETQIYQIPVLIDVSLLLYANGDDRTKTKISVFRNVFKYGMNRYFMRVWFNADNIQLLQPFASKSHYWRQEKLLATPALRTSEEVEQSADVAEKKSMMGNENENKTENDHKKDNAEKNGKDEEKEKEKFWMEESALSLKELFDNFVIKMSNISSNYSYIEAITENKTKMLCIREYDGMLTKCICVQNTSKHDKYEIDVLYITNENPNDDITEEPDIETMNLETTFVKFEQCMGDSYTSNNTNTNNRKSESKKKNCNESNGIKTEEFYRIYTMYKRPIIDFSFNKLFDQLFDSKIKKSKLSNIENKKLLDDLLGCDDIPSDNIKNMAKCALFCWIKPLNISLHDSNWDSHWSDNVKNEYETVWLNWYTLSQKKHFQHWKTGIWFCKPQESGRNGGSGGLISEKTFINWFHAFTGQIGVFLDITKEFDQFQDVLKKDWLKAKAKYEQEQKKFQIIINTGEFNGDWDNRKYFMNHVYFNQEENKVYYQYWVHLDNKKEIRSIIDFKNGRVTEKLKAFQQRRKGLIDH